MSDAPAIALIEYTSVALGTRAADALAKKAPVDIVRVGTFQPGRFAVLFEGDVASVQESFAAGCQYGAESVLDRVLLPDVNRSVYDAVGGATTDWSPDTLGIIETPTLAAVLEAADAAVKGANVCIVQLRLGDGLGGKGLAYFTGEQADVEAAIEIGCGRIANRSAPACSSIIPRWDDALREKLSRSTRFGEGW
ncbi:MAG: propanediol utilization: polyhedral bodies pduT [Phycisphaerae bacterium]|nr:MAG: BMC domain-containing protein [Planctomycetia bacterium]RIK68680.1 MAG: propanediol utilization protein [Planctomycetota bacterium]GJQ25598.1 MAG: propanediol utilization: polyhedral bodies pduT [Phycisphaerae bacterium]